MKLDNSAIINNLFIYLLDNQKLQGVYLLLKILKHKNLKTIILSLFISSKYIIFINVNVCNQ